MLLKVAYEATLVAGATLANAFFLALAVCEALFALLRRRHRLETPIGLRSGKGVITKRQYRCDNKSEDEDGVGSHVELRIVGSLHWAQRAGLNERSVTKGWRER